MNAEIGNFAGKSFGPDDSVSVSKYEGVSPEEAAKIVHDYDLRGGPQGSEEVAQYAALQQIADKGGLLADDMKDDTGPFVNDADMIRR